MEIVSKCISSLEKVMLGSDFSDYKERCFGRALIGERFNFQIAYTLKNTGRHRLSVKIETELSSVSARVVTHVPTMMPSYADCDDYIISKKPGLFPDVLEPISKNGFSVTNDRISVLWITVLTDGANAGKYPIKISLCAGEKTLNEAVFTLEILPEALPEQKLICTNWFYADCLCDHYFVPAFSEKHWEIIENFIKTASEHGINMILTPIFTPPLDTAIGGERTTVQLVDVKKDGEKYKFGFNKLKRWTQICIRNGIKYLEISHLFTQWGAKNAPKIMATENGEYKRIFGWETDAYGEEYTNFLSQLFPALVKFFKRNDIQNMVYFHISDEPSIGHIEKYTKASKLLRKFIKDDFHVIDALSDYEFYKTGAIEIPIPGTNHVEPFIKNGVENLWCYYCCSQYYEVSNRFLAMPSARNRVLGVQLYKFDIKGFLQWGYNFWNSQFSHEKIDPFHITDAGEAFPGGDGFVVYPSPDGKAIKSLRLEVFTEALQDMRALQALEAKIGRQRVIEIIDEGLETPVTFKKYPHGDEWLLTLRDKINELLIKN